MMRLFRMRRTIWQSTAKPRSPAHSEARAWTSSEAGAATRSPTYCVSFGECDEDIVKVRYTEWT